MLLTQVVVDALQMSASLPRYYLEGDCFAFRWWKVVVGLVVIDWVEVSGGGGRRGRGKGMEISRQVRKSEEVKGFGRGGCCLFL